MVERLSSQAGRWRLQNKTFVPLLAAAVTFVSHCPPPYRVCGSQVTPVVPHQALPFVTATHVALSLCVCAMLPDDFSRVRNEHVKIRSNRKTAEARAAIRTNIFSAVSKQPRIHRTPDKSSSSTTEPALTLLVFVAATVLLRSYVCSVTTRDLRLC